MHIEIDQFRPQHVINVVDQWLKGLITTYDISFDKPQALKDVVTTVLQYVQSNPGVPFEAAVNNFVTMANSVTFADFKPNAIQKFTHDQKALDLIDQCFEGSPSARDSIVRAHCAALLFGHVYVNDAAQSLAKKITTHSEEDLKKILGSFKNEFDKKFGTKNYLILAGAQTIVQHATELNQVLLDNPLDFTIHTQDRADREPDTVLGPSPRPLSVPKRG